MKNQTILPYEHVLVLGLAKSGTAAAKVLLEHGIAVRVNDGKTAGNEQSINELQALGAEVITGSHPVSVLEDVTTIVKNPGIPYEHPLIQEAKNRQVPIITEIELAGQLAKGPIIGITGSNGKTTTTSLTGEMLIQSNLSVKIAGNIGTAAVEVANNADSEERLLLELSSFQLLGVQSFRPKISALLNIYEAHLDYHKTVDNYVQAKSNIFKNQTAEDMLVYNADDSTILRMVKDARARLVPFSVRKWFSDGACLHEQAIYFQGERIVDVDDIALVGEHNLANILAAISIAKSCGATDEAIKYVLKTFTGVRHRLQFVANIQGRSFYNDSKATNVLATQKALRAFSQPVILLAGGLDRGNGFQALKKDLTHVKKMVLFGETAKKIQSIANELKIESTIVDTMDEAVKLAYNVSSKGDVVLLSPACASWDQYRTFEERGDMFIQAVHKLA
ncbi:UDP-N-acetylmuramoyl-L-alanine--D-glutamate ligase [Virgibacillus sp. W0430]|uniref:UDP-N-acetylmuramoyl-L-alanine--D-glutamate ligase n=1 Tax=Virgibacillus sp. W0430 TaxID=3391580 RepID=UPI003F4585EF